MANGGIGVILDGGGDDVYEFDYICARRRLLARHGFRPRLRRQRPAARRDAEGLSTAADADGAAFQRFSNGFGCHYALGFCFDDDGDDTYDGTIMGVGFAWDVAVGRAVRFRAATTATKPPAAAPRATAPRPDWECSSTTPATTSTCGYGQGYASSSISYHRLPQCGGNFSFVIDYGGKDKYGCGARNNSYIERGSSGGYLIDRPKREEIEANAAAKEGTPPAVAGS